MRSLLSYLATTPCRNLWRPRPLQADERPIYGTIYESVVLAGTSIRTGPSASGNKADSGRVEAGILRTDRAEATDEPLSATGTRNSILFAEGIITVLPHNQRQSKVWANSRQTTEHRNDNTQCQSCQWRVLTIMGDTAVRAKFLIGAL